MLDVERSAAHASEGASAHLERSEIWTDALGVVLNDLEGDLMSSFGRLADAVVDGIEGTLGMLEATWGEIGSDEDGAVLAVIDSVPGFEHSTVARQGGVVADKLQLVAMLATWLHVLVDQYYRHLASVLFALEDGDSVLAGWKGGERILGGIAQWEAFGKSVFCAGGNLEFAIDGLRLLAIASDNDIHRNLTFNI
mgnify:CR=1 FL=1